MEKPSYKLISAIILGAIIINVIMSCFLTDAVKYPNVSIAFINLMWMLEISVFGFLLGKKQKGATRGILYILLFLVITVISNSIFGLMFSWTTMQNVYGIITGEIISGGIILFVILSKLYRNIPTAINDSQSKSV